MSAALSTATKGNISFDADTFNSHFDRAPFLVRHNLAGHPLFSLARLIELAKRLPNDHIEYSSGRVPVNLDPTLTPATGLSVEETIRRIESCGSWMVLKYVEQDPEYRELLHDCLGEVERCAKRLVPGLCRREGFIFITSPFSTTPYHMDHEHNFLLQIRGQKRVSIFDPADRSILSEEELERFYSGSHRNLVYRDEYQRKAMVFELAPGAGLHFPVNAPHWVKTGGEVSVSFSVTFRSEVCERKRVIYGVNADLRRLGFKPRPVGRSQLRDTVKYNAFRAVRRSRAVIRSLIPVKRD